jgi:hypothetical protein
VEAIVAPSSCPVPIRHADSIVRATRLSWIAPWIHPASTADSISPGGAAPRSCRRRPSISRPRWMRTPSVAGLQFSSRAISSRVMPPK